MRKFKYFLVLGIIILAVFILIKIVFDRPEGKVKGLISPISEITLTISPSATPSALPIASVSAEVVMLSPTKIPTPKPIATPSMTSFEEVSGFVDRFSGQYGVDPNVIRHLAICESGFRSNATNGPYVGLFQFGSITWQNFRKEMGEDPNPELRYSAEESVQTAAYALSKGKGKIWPNCMP